MRISVIGTGYLGATHAAGMAELGFEVIGIDTDADKIAALAEGRLPFHEPALPELLRRARRVRAAALHHLAPATPPTSPTSTSSASARRRAPTARPTRPTCDAAVEALVPLLRRPSLVVGKSTVPVGTAEALAARIAELAPAGVEVGLAWNPEFLREGYAVHDTLHPNRIVLGTTDPAAERTLREVYAARSRDGYPGRGHRPARPPSWSRSPRTPSWPPRSPSSTRWPSSARRPAPTSTLLSEALGHDERIGHRFLGSGLGFGGGCLPKDIRALVARADELGVGGVRRLPALGRRASTCVVATGRRDGGRPGRLVPRRPDRGARRGLQARLDDVRDSPALDVARRLEEAGAHVTVYDPAANLTARAVAPRLRFARTRSPRAARPTWCCT